MFVFQFMEVVDVIAKGTSAQDELFRLFNEQGYSDYVVVYLRFITSSELQRDAEFYANFIEGDRTVVEFCHQVTAKLCTRLQFIRCFVC